MVNLLRLIGVLSIIAFAACAAPASAYVCSAVITDQNSFAAQCQTLQTSCANNPTFYGCSTGSCTYAGNAVPACSRFIAADPSFRSDWGFNGTCETTEPGDGPQFEFTGSGAPPASSCFGPCNADTSHCSCIGLPNGEQNCVCATTKDGALCVPGAGEEEPQEPENGNCEASAQINGQCIEVTNENDPSTPNDTEICIGAVCVPLPSANPQGECSQGSTAAVCIGPPGGGQPPRPSAPYPPTQAPSFSTSASSASSSSSSSAISNVNAYGAPGSQATDPNEDGSCPAGTSALGQVCVCPAGQLWTGAACAQGDPEDEGEERTAGAGSCDIAPACAGDQIDCSVVYQTWVTRCALESSQAPPVVDLASDPLEGLELFETDAMGPGGLDSDGWLSSGCPQIAPIPVLGMSLTFPPVWCELSWLGTLLVSIAYLIALRIVYGE